MIDIKKVQESFNKFTDSYDLSEYNKNRKYHHSYRVQSISKELAQNLVLDEDSINLAASIGLLHDIGRFEQLDKYMSFDDLNTFDHGDYGADFLSKNLRNFIDDDKYDKHGVYYADPTNQNVRESIILNGETKSYCLKWITDIGIIDDPQEVYAVFAPEVLENAEQFSPACVRTQG